MVITVKHTLVYLCWRQWDEHCLELEIHEALQGFSPSQRPGIRLREGGHFAQSCAMLQSRATFGSITDQSNHHIVGSTPAGVSASWAEDTYAEFKTGLATNTLELFQFQTCVSAVLQLSIHKQTLDAYTRLS